MHSYTQYVLCWLLLAIIAISQSGYTSMYVFMFDMLYSEAKYVDTYTHNRINGIM